MLPIEFTAYLWLNWVILGLTLGAFWTLGCWIVTALIAALRPGPG